MITVTRCCDNCKKLLEVFEWEKNKKIICLECLKKCLKKCLKNGHLDILSRSNKGENKMERNLETAKEIIKSLLSLKSKIDWSNLTFEEQEDLQTNIDIAERFLDLNYLEEQE